MPMKFAHVSILNNAISTVLEKTEANADGSYSLFTDEKGPYSVRYSGLINRSETILVYTDYYCSEKIEVQLSQIRFPRGKCPRFWSAILTIGT